MIHLIFELIRAVLGLLILVLIVQVVLSWLFAFDIISRRNAAAASVDDFTRRVSDPLVAPFRRMIPPVGGFDLSIMVVLFILFFLRSNVSYWLEGVLRGGPIL